MTYYMNVNFVFEVNMYTDLLWMLSLILSPKSVTLIVWKTLRPITEILVVVFLVVAIYDLNEKKR